VFAVSGCPFCEPRDQGLCLARIFSAASRPLNDVNPRPGAICAKQNRANKENARGKRLPGGFYSPSTRRVCSMRISSAMLVRDRRTSSANGAFSRHERLDNAGMRLVTAASG
jgi:hypothetical protein